MHQSSYEIMQDFYRKYLDNKFKTKKRIIDIGSKNINGTYKNIFPSHLWEYVGLDMESGDNVDIVVKDPYNWEEIESSSFDVLISGQSLEHIEFPWIVFNEIFRILKNEGITCIIAPSSGPEHKYPVDCWRFYPDGMKALCKHSGLKCLDVFTDWNPIVYEDGSEIWKDTVLIAKKM